MPGWFFGTLTAAGRSPKVSMDSDFDAANICRVINSQRNEVSREVLLVLSAALVLDAAGYKYLHAKLPSSCQVCNDGE